MFYTNSGREISYYGAEFSNAVKRVDSNDEKRIQTLDDLFSLLLHVSGGGTHYFNKINGRYIDLTRDQFDLYDIPLQYETNVTIDRSYCGKNANTQKRYRMLLKNLSDIIKEQKLTE